MIFVRCWYLFICVGCKECEDGYVNVLLGVLCGCVILMIVCLKLKIGFEKLLMLVNVFVKEFSDSFLLY